MSEPYDTKSPKHDHSSLTLILNWLCLGHIVEKSYLTPSLHCPPLSFSRRISPRCVPAIGLFLLRELDMEFRQKTGINSRCFSEPNGLLQCFTLSLRERVLDSQSKSLQQCRYTTLRKPSGHKPAFGDKPLRHMRNTQSSHIISCRNNERMAHCPVSVWLIPH